MRRLVSKSFLPLMHFTAEHKVYCNVFLLQCCLTIFRSSKTCGVAKDGGTWGGDFEVSPFFGPKTGEDQKKVFAVKVVDFRYKDR